jgi:uncharacterized protein (TIGR03083 family)
VNQRDCIDAIQTHGGRLADAAIVAGLAAPVASCAPWTVHELVRHTAVVCQFWQGLASGSFSDPGDFVPVAEPPAADVIDAYRADVEATVATLAPLDPATPCWTWSAQQDIGFVQRRLAHELAVHAWDATMAAGQPQAIDGSLAVDGIDEYLELFVPAGTSQGDGDPLTGHLHATDTDGEWFLRVGGGQWTVERTHAKADVAIRGTASDLLLALWGRQPLASGAFEVFGDADAVAGLLTRVAMS